MATKSVTSEIIKLTNVRLSFPVIWRPKSFEEGKPAQYQATFLLDPSDKEHAKQIKLIKATAKKTLIAAFGEVPAGFKRCFGLADKHPKKKNYDGYQGMFYLSTGNTTQPTLVDRKRQDVYEKDGVLYAGCYVNTNPTFWTFDHPKGGQGIAANLRIIQFFRDGEPFGNAPAKADEELDDVDIDDDDEDVDDEWDEDEEEDDLD